MRSKSTDMQEEFRQKEQEKRRQQLCFTKIKPKKSVTLTPQKKLLKNATRCVWRKKEQELMTFKSGLNFSKRDNPSSTPSLLFNSPNCGFKISQPLWKSMSPGSKHQAKQKLQSDELAKGSNLNNRKALGLNLSNMVNKHVDAESPLSAFNIRLSNHQMLRLLLRHIYVFQYLPQQKNAEAIKFCGILKKYVSKNLKYIFLFKKRNVSINKKVLFVFHTIFKLNFITQIIYSILFSYFCCSLVSVSGKWNIKTMLTLLYSYNWQKCKKMNKKKNVGE